MTANSLNIPTATKGYKGIGMDGFIARWYAKNVQSDINEYKKSAQQVAENISAGSHVLELAPGPGLLIIELAKLGHYQLTGLDISQTFVEIAQQKAKEAGVNIDFRQGNAAAMPFDAETFDFIVCKAAFKNFQEPVKALDEMRRVLKKGGRALIIDLRPDASPQAIDKYVDNMGSSKINTFLTKWAFRLMLLKRAYSKDTFAEFIAKSQFNQGEIHESLLGLEIWLNK